MPIKFYTPVYALTLLLSAILLFSIQPMFSKMVLPLLGGTPQVWNTAMLFFQVTLLAGYAYAHISSKILPVKAQALLQLILLIIFVYVLPFGIPEGTQPPITNDPTFWQLALMAGTIGGPFFVLAGSAPLLQRWFSQTDHPDADNPYFLYGASNLGSMGALLAYPVLLEPFLDLTQQAKFWALGYVVLIACVTVAGLLVWKRSQLKSNKPSSKQADPMSISWALRLKWLALSFVPSSLMLGVTTFITTDIASVPLLWILPLALYLSTFIIVFARRQLFSIHSIMALHAILMVALIIQMLVIDVPPFALIAFHMALFFVAALSCHAQLASLKPEASKLTEFYLIMSIGGALGGVFNALIAPNYFIIPIEYALALVAACLLRYIGRKPVFKIGSGFFVLAAIAALAIISLGGFPDWILFIIAFGLVVSFAWVMNMRFIFTAAIAVCLLAHPPGYDWGNGFYKDILHHDRNFFGVMKVIDTASDERILLHGTTNHGTQALIEEHRLTPLSYYSETSPLRDVFSIFDARNGEQNIGVLGLGVGVVACYQKDNRHFDFFEIDPDIVRVAENKDYFTFLSDCGSSYDTILGDGRLTIKDKPDQSYDLIVLDAFSSDNIPMHLLTIEAIELYLQKLKPNGVLTFNISNNYLDIEPVLTLAAEHLSLKGYAKLSEGLSIEGTNIEGNLAEYFAFTDNMVIAAQLEAEGWTEGMKRSGVRLWTDKFTNIVSVLGNKTGLKRMKALLAAEEKENIVAE